MSFVMNETFLYFEFTYNLVLVHKNERRHIFVLICKIKYERSINKVIRVT